MENNDRQVKQVIVIDKSKQMNVGKIVAQGGHASLGALLTLFDKNNSNDIIKYNVEFNKNSILDKWLNGIFTKVCLGVNSEDEMVDIYNKITEYNKTAAEKIPIVMIEDCGKTCFHGEKTKTCIGIGPFWSDVLDNFTGHLKLFR